MNRHSKILKCCIIGLCFLVAAIICIINLPEVKFLRMSMHLKEKMAEYNNPLYEEIQPLKIYKNRQTLPYEDKIALNIGSPLFDVKELATDTYKLDQISFDYNGTYDNQEKKILGYYTAGKTGFNLLEGNFFVDGDKAYIDLPKILKNSFYINLKQLGKDFNQSEIARVTNTKLPKDFSIHLFSNTKEEDWNEIETYKKELLQHAKTLKSYVKLENSHKTATVQKGDSQITAKAITLTIQAYAINDMLKYIDVVCLKSELYKSQAKHLFISSNQRDFFEEEILSANYTQDVVLDLYLDSKNHLVKIETDSPFMIGDDKVLLDIAFVGENNSLSDITGMLVKNGGKGKGEYSFEVHTGNLEKTYENQISVLKQRKPFLSYYSVWDKNDKSLSVDINAVVDQTEKEIGLKGTFDKVIIGEGYIFHIADFHMKTDGTEDFRVAGEISQFPEEQKKIPEAPMDITESVNLLLLTGDDVFKIVYESLGGIVQNLFKGIR